MSSTVPVRLNGIASINCLLLRRTEERRYNHFRALSMGAHDAFGADAEPPHSRATFFIIVLGPPPASNCRQTKVFPGMSDLEMNKVPRLLTNGRHAP
jgi:hypothetical protein